MAAALRQPYPRDGWRAITPGRRFYCFTPHAYTFDTNVLTKTLPPKLQPTEVRKFQNCVSAVVEFLARRRLTHILAAFTAFFIAPVSLLTAKGGETHRMPVTRGDAEVRLHHPNRQ